MRAATPSPNRVPFGTTTPARPPAGALEPAHDELQEQQGGFLTAPVFGEVVADAGLLLAAEGRVGEDDVDPLGLADLGEAKPQRVAGVDARRVQAVQQQVHLRQQEGQGLGLAGVDAALLQDAALLDRIGLFFPGGGRFRPGSRRCRRPGPAPFRRPAGR